MHLLGAIIGGALLLIVRSLVLRAITALGMGLVVYTGLNQTMGWLKTQAIDKLKALPPETLEIMAYCEVGTCISMIFSAIAIRFTLKGLTSGSLVKWVTTT